MSTHNETLTYEIARVSPPVAVTGVSLAGVTLQDWVLVVTLIYTVLNGFFLLRDKVYIPWKEKRNGSNRETTG